MKQKELLKDLLPKLPSDLPISICDYEGDRILFLNNIQELKEEDLLNKQVIIYQYQQDIIQGSNQSTNPYILKYINIILNI